MRTIFFALSLLLPFTAAKGACQNRTDVCIGSDACNIIANSGFGTCQVSEYQDGACTIQKYTSITCSCCYK
ncbi:hypothetical protein WAI453_001382 [Rhynchosporium graminicola]